MTTPIAYLMENDEAKWLGYEPDPQADWVTPLYKEKWKMTKDTHAEQVERDCAEIDRAFAEAAYQRGYMDGMAKPCPDCADRKPQAGDVVVTKQWFDPVSNTVITRNIRGENCYATKEFKNVCDPTTILKLIAVVEAAKEISGEYWEKNAGTLRDALKELKAT